MGARWALDTIGAPRPRGGAVGADPLGDVAAGAAALCGVLGAAGDAGAAGPGAAGGVSGARCRSGTGEPSEDRVLRKTRSAPGPVSGMRGAPCWVPAGARNGAPRPSGPSPTGGAEPA